MSGYTVSAQNDFTQEQRTAPVSGFVPRDRLIGRNRDISRLVELIRKGERLITLVGSAGMGKTRLAKEVASRFAADNSFRGQVFVCELTEAQNGRAMTAAVGLTLGMSLSDTSDVSALVSEVGDALAARGKLLLVLDNFDQLLAQGEAILDAWLSRASQLRVIVTSRSSLHREGEIVHEVGPLSLPAESPTGSDALRLLVERAQRARADWELSSDEAPIAKRIVEELDGNPLAIELAAPRLVVLGAQRLLDRLQDRFAILRSAADEERSLWNAIEHSWDMLSTPERDVLAQCTVFRGGFTLEDAEGVIELSPDAGPVMDILSSLFDRSLLRLRTDGLEGSRRFDMFLSIREHAAMKLAESGLRQATLERYAAHFAGRANAERVDAEGRAPKKATLWFRTERFNLLHAAQAARHIGKPAFAVAIAHALFPVAPHVVLKNEIVEFLNDVLIRGGLEGEDLAKALVIRAYFLYQQGNFEEAAAMAASVEERAPGAIWVARSYETLGYIALSQGNALEAVRQMERSVALLRQVRNQLYEGRVQRELSHAYAALGRTEEAANARHRALQLASQAGSARDEVLALFEIGAAAIDADRLDEAEMHLRRAIAQSEELGLDGFSPSARAFLGLAHGLRGRYDQARKLLERAIPELQALSQKRYEVGFTGYLGVIERLLGHDERSRSLLRDASTRLASDNRYGAFFQANLAGVEANLGDDVKAQSLLRNAESRIAQAGDPYFALAVELERAIGAARELLNATEEARQNQLRATIEAARAAAHAINPQSGKPYASESADVRLSLQILQETERGTLKGRSIAPGQVALVIGPQAKWFLSPDGKRRVDLSDREMLRRVLWVLIQARIVGTPFISRDKIVAEVWPDDTGSPKAAYTRLRVAVSTLRGFGLRTAIRTSPTGFGLAEDIELILE